MQSDSGTADLPGLAVQGKFWDEWNQTWRFREPDHFMERQREVALAVAEGLHRRAAHILDVGCGTGWLGDALKPFGKVWATDLSESAIAEGRRRHPDVQFVHGDFLTVDLPGQFDFVVSADALFNFYDQPAYVHRIAQLLHPGGTLLLMTPNRDVWRRRSALKPLGHGQVQHWLSPNECAALLRPHFTVERFATMDPGGDKGLLWWVENRYVRGGMGRLFGRQRWQRILEAARLGRELIFVAHRQA